MVLYIFVSTAKCKGLHSTDIHYAHSTADSEINYIPSDGYLDAFMVVSLVWLLVSFVHSLPSSFAVAMLGYAFSRGCGFLYDQ